MSNGKHSAGKGSKYRPVDQKKWEDNWNKVFGNKKTNNKKTTHKKKKGNS
jgi:hypothetical protein